MAVIRNILNSILARRSSAAAAVSQVTPTTMPAWLANPQPPADQAIEAFHHTETVDFLELGTVEEAWLKANGQLQRKCEKRGVTIGCGHLVTQFQPVKDSRHPIRGIAGVCLYCEKELKTLLLSRHLSPSDYDRLILVCTDCVRMTQAGNLCCPRHSSQRIQSTGEIIYLGPDEVIAEQRQERVGNAIKILRNLFMKTYFIDIRD